jgi:hypothetical protein
VSFCSEFRRCYPQRPIYHSGELRARALQRGLKSRIMLAIQGFCSSPAKWPCIVLVRREEESHFGGGNGAIGWNVVAEAVGEQRSKPVIR